MRRYIYIIMCVILQACGHDGSINKPQPAAPAESPKVAAASKPEANKLEVSKPEANKAVASAPSSKGIIQSVVDVPVYSLITSVVTDMKVHLGQHVKAGQLLVTLNSTEIENRIALSQSEIQQAQFQYESIIVGQGYDIDNPQAIPDKILKAARIRSSLPVYEEQLKINRQQLEYCRIKSPVSGVVSDVTIHQHDLAQQGIPLFRIIDPNNLRVEFTILESEVSRFKVGSTVNVSTLAYPHEVHKATVTDIKPKVEETGMLFLRASLTDNLHLMPGMTAMVTLAD